MKLPVTVELLRDGADWYARSNGLPVFEVAYASVVADPVRGKYMGSLYLDAPVYESDAIPAYEAFRAETSDQFAFLTLPIEWGGLGVEVEVCRDDPYPNAAALVRDIEGYGRLKVWATVQCGNPHPFLSDEENDMFRAVHDAFGHAATGRGFNPDGEEAAWCKHSQMYSPLARRAMTTETRGQNSALVFCGDGRTFPKQKVCLLPPEFSDLKSVSYAPTPKGGVLDALQRTTGCPARAHRGSHHARERLGRKCCHATAVPVRGRTPAAGTAGNASVRRVRELHRARGVPAVMRYQPDGLLKRAFSALVLLLAIAYGAHLVSSWLAPLVPVVVVLVVLGGIYTVVFGRRR